MGIAGSNNDGKHKSDEDPDNESIVVIGDEEIVNDDDSRLPQRKHPSAGENQFKESIVVIGDEEIVNINDVTEQKDPSVGSSRTQTRCDDDEVPPGNLVPPPVESSSTNVDDRMVTFRKITVPLAIQTSLERRENMSMYGLDAHFWAKDLTDDHNRDGDIAGGISYKLNNIVDVNFLEPQLRTMLDTRPRNVKYAKFPSHFDESLRACPVGLTGIFSLASRHEIQQGILCHIHVPTPAELIVEKATESSRGAIRRLPQVPAEDLSEVMIENELWEENESAPEVSVEHKTVETMQEHDLVETEVPMPDEFEINFSVNENPTSSVPAGETSARILEEQEIARQSQLSQFLCKIGTYSEMVDGLEARVNSFDLHHGIHVAGPARSSEFLTVRQHLEEMHKVPDGMEAAIRQVHEPSDRYIARKTQLLHDLSLYSHAFNSLKQELRYNGSEPTDDDVRSTDDPPPPDVPTMPGPPFDSHRNPDEMMSRANHNRLMRDYRCKLNTYVGDVAEWSRKLVRYVEMKERLLKRYQDVVLTLLRQKFKILGLNVPSHFTNSNRKS